MRDWIAALREGDPAAAERLTKDDADAMRRLIVATAREERPHAVWWPRALAFASVVALMVVASAVGARQLADREQVAAPGAAGAALESGERRQLQFSTPGGTRIIWVFNSEFRLKEIMP